MRKLICAKDVEECMKENKKSIYIEDNTIITPSARDMAENLGIAFVKKQPVEEPLLNGDKIQKLFALLTQKGMLQEFLNVIKKPFEEKIHSSGLKIIDGKSVRMDSYKIDGKSTNLTHQEILSQKDFPMSVGLFEATTFETEIEIKEDQINYVIDGELDIEIDGEHYEGSAGDIIFLPKDVKIVCSAKDGAKLFYVKCSNNI